MLLRATSKVSNGRTPRGGRGGSRSNKIKKNLFWFAAIVLDREYLDEAYEPTLEEIKVIMERVIREDLRNGGLIVYYYSWTKINYKKDFTAVFSITKCDETWEIYKEAQNERLIMIALTEPNCPRLPRDKAFMVSSLIESSSQLKLKTRLRP